MSDKTHWTDIALNVLGWIMAIITLRWIAGIFKGKDGKWDVDELKKFTAFVVGVGSFIYVLRVEATRSTVEHIFSDLWVVAILTFMLGVLHMDHLIDKVSELIKLIIELRTRRPSGDSDKEP